MKEKQKELIESFQKNFPNVYKIAYNQGKIDVINDIRNYKFKVYTVENALMDGNYKLSTVSSDHAIPVKALDDYLEILTPAQE